MSLGIRLVPYVAYRESLITEVIRDVILLLFNPIQSDPNNLKRPLNLEV